MARVRGADPLVGALGKHLALIGFMGAGKSTIGREVAKRTARPFVDTDAEIERLGRLIDRDLSSWLQPPAEAKGQSQAAATTTA